MADPKTSPAAAPPEPTTAQAIAQLAASLRPQGPLEMAGLSPEHIAAITKAPAPQRFREIPWRSDATGATGIAHVVESKKCPNGRITSIAGYRHPPEAYTYQAQGGMVPDGFPMWDKDQRAVPEGQEPMPGDLSGLFKQWRYETFYRSDLRQFIGAEIKAYACQDAEAGLKTPWQISKVGSAFDD